jgi:hypothetical protein
MRRLVCAHAASSWWASHIGGWVHGVAVGPVLHAPSHPGAALAAMVAAPTAPAADTLSTAPMIAPFISDASTFVCAPESLRLVLATDDPPVLGGTGASAAAAQEQRELARAADTARTAALSKVLAAGPAGIGRASSLWELTALLEHWEALGEEPSEMMFGALERRSRALLRGADPAGIAALASAIARTQRRGRASLMWVAAVAGALLSSAQRPLPPAVWAVALPALAKLSDGSLDARVARAALADSALQLPGAPPADVALLLAAVAKARAAPGPGWLQHLAGVLAATAPRMAPSQLVTCLRSLALLTEQAVTGSGSRAGATAVEAAARAVSAGLAARLAALGPAALAGAAPGELASALWALARLGHRGCGVGEACPATTLLPHILEQLPRLTPTQLSGCASCVFLPHACAWRARLAGPAPIPANNPAPPWPLPSQPPVGAHQAGGRAPRP